jgi:hypothetical protein
MPTLLLTLDISTALELLAHKQRVARTSSSRTAAMLDPLFRVSGDEKIAKLRKPVIGKSLEARRELLREIAREAGFPIEGEVLDQQLKIFQKAYPNRVERYDAIERINDDWPSSRVIAFMVSATLENLRWIIDRRFADAGEVEVNLLDALQQVRTVLDQIPSS